MRCGMRRPSEVSDHSDVPLLAGEHILNRKRRNLLSSCFTVIQLRELRAWPSNFQVYSSFITSCP